LPESSAFIFYLLTHFAALSHDKLKKRRYLLKN